MNEYLVVVPASDLVLFEYLEQRFKGDPATSVARRPPQDPATGPGRLAACGGARSRSHRRSSRREPSVDPDRALTTR